MDILTDVLVLKQFAEVEGGSAYFLVSLLIFLAATSAYSLLFVSTYGLDTLSVGGRVLLFLCAVPFSQLVPVFTWIESFESPIIDKLLMKTKVLKPTSQRWKAPQDNKGVDQLWTFLRENYARHAGFMAEAVVEALPQAALQTYAAVALEKMSMLTIISVLMSCLVLASKGYVVSYSIDRRVCGFNAACVAADLFNAFACLSWLATSKDPLLKRLAMLSTSLFIAGVFCAFIFMVCDDHLKQWRPSTSRPHFGTATWFDLYVVRSLVFLCALLPLGAFFLVSRLVFVPLLVLGSLDPEHANHHDFYSFVFHTWVGSKDFDLKLLALNEVLEAARKTGKGLTRALDYSKDNETAKEKIKNWALALASPDDNRYNIQPLERKPNFRYRTSQSFSSEDNINVSFDADILSEQRHFIPTTQKKKSFVKTFLSKTFPKSTRRLRDLWKDIVERSDILSFFDATVASGGAPPKLSLCDVSRSLLVVIGASSLLAGAFLFLLFVPVALAFHGVALIFAPLKLFLHYYYGDSKNPLALALTWALLIIALPLIFLAPRVHRFRTLKDQVADTRDLHAAVYDSKHLRGVVARRYLAKVAARALKRAILLKTVDSIAAYIIDDFLGGDAFFLRDHKGLDLWKLALGPPPDLPPRQRRREEDLIVFDDDDDGKDFWLLSSSENNTAKRRGNRRRSDDDDDQGRRRI